MNKMCADEMARCKSGDERKLAGHDGRGDDTSKALRVLSGAGSMCASETEEI
jgi:hypothetical protein